MKKTNNTTKENTTKTSLLKPFPFMEDESYLLKLKNGNYVVAYWKNGEFTSEFNDQYIEEEIESYIAVKDLGL